MVEILHLDKRFQRPVVFTMQFSGCRALLDTGATLPVWTASEDVLKALGGTMVSDNVSFSGFGGPVVAQLYQLTVSLGKIIYPNMHLIFSENEKIPGFLLLSATMFGGMHYTIDDENHLLTIDTRSNQAAYNLRIEDKNGDLYVLLN
ncbi:MAG: hypothetical protein LBI54_03715 [Lachnospiraceae bacterium]|jgi:hypothetical protein|nr:hypothetical protein [Lachnospiraceae bacterium]